MSSVAAIAGPIPRAVEGPQAEIRNRVRSLLALLYPGGHLVERRKERRYPYPQLLRLTPVADDGVTPLGPAIVVAGKQISEGGLGFFHREPLPHRRMIATLEIAQRRPIQLLIDISWCRFTAQGWYESGGRFLQTLPE